ncbi:MAG: DNA alkylation repair protein [Bacteroidota bacterium]
MTKAARIAEIKHALAARAKPANVSLLQRFFKTGKGEYGEGDVFIGVKVPQIRQVAREYKDVPLEIALTLLCSKIHEERLLALLLMVGIFEKGDEPVRKSVHAAYLKHTRYINNWDLVDTSAPHIVGAYLFTRGRTPLLKLARSSSIWERRIAIIATQHFIRKNDFANTLKIALVLREDKHDLIHKAVGWMLREVGERDRSAEEKFLLTHYHRMPRTMLRYAIEKLPEKRRQQYLLGKA